MLFEICALYDAGKELYSPETESSPAPSSDTGKATSRTNSFEIENLLKVRSVCLIIV
jgi:hypothetical protein